MPIKTIFQYLPEVEPPAEKKLSFNIKAKWTIIILVAFFVLANIPLYGLSGNALARFETLAVILGTDFGSVISLGIGPIVMASIILQLLVGSQILKIDTKTAEGKKFFQGLQKILVYFFIIFEASVYVLMQGLAPDISLGVYGPVILIVQLCLGGLAIYMMDEISSKWGFGSGVSLFIAAGVSWRVFTSLFQFIGTQGTFEPTGRILVLVSSIISGNQAGAFSAVAAIIVTIIIFLIIVWAQSLKVEIPLSYDRIRGYGIKWPLAFFYTSVMPVILVSALAANIQLGAGILDNAAQPCILNGVDSIDCTGMAKFSYKLGFLGRFSGNTPISGFAFWISGVNLLEAITIGGFNSKMPFQVLIHILFYVALSVIFAIFWMKTSGMDAQSQAKNIMSSGLTIPGFRKDERILETVLNRYILPLTIMGGAAIGLVAAISNVVGTLVGGTAILLVIMIMYQFYQNIAQQHAVDMHPALRKIIK
ncbi:MAG: preprotein translocase subunit SecY [Candidatus Pacearchaeota archaeon]